MILQLLLLLAFFTFGYWFWGFIEYLIHGVLSHRYRTPVGTMHWGHHRDTRRIFTSPIAAIIVTPLLWFLFSLVFGNLNALALSIGIVAGFGHYEYFHWAIHFREPKTDKQRLLRNHHLAHHFCNARMYHGVTTIFWDKVFKTLPDLETRDLDYKKVENTPVMTGKSNFKDTYTFQNLKTLFSAN